VEQSQPMKRIQIVLDENLLEATDRAARRMKRNRSAMVREALREYLKRLEVRSSEECDQQGYENQAQGRDEPIRWEAEAAWPPD
jgi:metal-responsive CopG/Arc/MetJ family transcriptional regulator